MLAAVLSGTPPAGTPAGTPADPLAAAIEHYQTVESYRVTIHSSHADGVEEIRYYYKKPGWVRMEFMRPHAGAVLVYNPDSQRVRLWPFGIGRFPELNLSPDNFLIQSSRGQRVDHSDVGALFENIRILREGGEAVVSGVENKDGHTVVPLIVTGADGVTIAKVHRYELWLDMASQFPVKVISRDGQNAVMETVLLEALEINPTLPDTWFNPQK